MPPDIIMVILDDARAGEIQLGMPDTLSIMPGAVTAENFFCTTPCCGPSRASMLTGKYAHNHGVRTNAMGWQAFRSQEHQTIAVALSAAGYTTALVGKYMNGYDRDVATPPGWDRWHAGSGQPKYYNPHGDYLPDIRATRAAEITFNEYSPLFLVYSDVIPHNSPECNANPCAAQRHKDEFLDYPGTIRKRLQALRTIDDAVVGIADELGSERWANACVVIVSDNGFMLGEHGYHGKNRPYDEAVRTPAIFSEAFGITDANRIMGNIDLAPTIAAAAGFNLSWPKDGYPLQDNWWYRNGILLENWAAEPRGETFEAFRTRDETYVEYADGRKVLWDRQLDWETESYLTPENESYWADRLEEARTWG
jgi:arylsulfatase A-like enzyme